MNIEILCKSLVALLGVWFAVYYLWRDYRIDAFRDHLFSIRDRLFLFAAEGHISFEHPAYAILRDRMNLMLRHGDEFTLTRLLFILTLKSPPKPETLVRWEAAVEGLPEWTQYKLKEFNFCFLSAVVQHVVYFSFFRYVILRPLMLLVRPLRFRKVVDRPQVTQTVEQLESRTAEREERELVGAAA